MCIWNFMLLYFGSIKSKLALHWFTCFLQNPTHTCCKFEAEEAKRKQEEEEEKQKLEEIKGESNDASIEGQPDIQPEKVDTVISEVEVQSLETAPKPTTLAPKPTIKRKTIDNTPIQTITQNDVEKQLLEGMTLDLVCIFQ